MGWCIKAGGGYNGRYECYAVIKTEHQCQLLSFVCWLLMSAGTIYHNSSMLLPYRCLVEIRIPRFGGDGDDASGPFTKVHNFVKKALKIDSPMSPMKQW
jgi:hypothetical protein